MGRTGQIVFSVILAVALPYSLGLGFLDAVPLAVYGMWAMMLARDRVWWKCWLEVAALVAVGLVVMNLRTSAPRWLFPPLEVLGALALLWAALAWTGERNPEVWLPWLVAAVFYFAPGEYFVAQYLAAAALAIFAITCAMPYAKRLLRSKIHR